MQLGGSRILYIVGLSVGALFHGSCLHALAVDLPALRVENVRRAFHNGEHNAFTDLCRYRDRFYLTFRSCPDGHGVHPSSSIIVLTSDDAQNWRQVHRFSVPRRDTRDPHFLVFKDKLFVFTGTWYCGETSPDSYDMNQHLGYGMWSGDGVMCSEPAMREGAYGHYIWRADVYGDRAYLCGRRKREFMETRTREERDPVVESALLASDDGLVWHKVGLFQEEYGDETAFLFEDDGSITAVARSGGGRNAQLCLLTSPRAEAERIDLGRYIGGPLLARWAGRYVVGGRKTVGGPAKTSLYWLAEDALNEFAELPSGGDNSYPGLVALSPQRAIVSWYSSHESEAGRSITAIYLADLTMESAGK